MQHLASEKSIYQPSQRQALIILFLAALPLFFIAISDSQSWGDDFAQYLKEGQNIAENKPYNKSNYIYNSLNPDYAPPSYPPGFPLLLAPIIKCFGLKIRPILYLISTFCALLLFIHFVFFRRYFNTLNALCLAVISVYCGSMINLKGYVLSDIPLLLFTSLYLAIRGQKKFENLKWILLAIVAVMAFLVRSQGLILVLAEGITLLVLSSRNVFTRSFSLADSLRSYPLKFFMAFLLLYFAATMIFNIHSDSLSFYVNLFDQYHGHFFTIVRSNTAYLAELLTDILHFDHHHSAAQVIISVGKTGAAILALVGFIFQLKKAGAFPAVFFILMCLLIILLPVKQGLRYLLPALPVYLLFAALGARMIVLKFFANRWQPVSIACTVIFLMLGKDNYARIPYDPSWTPYTPEDSLAFAFIREYVKDPEIIVFSKPRALTLFTNKKAMNIAYQKDAHENRKQFDKMKIKYMLVREDLDENFIGKYLQETKTAKDSLKIGTLYTLYTVR